MGTRRERRISADSYCTPVMIASLTTSGIVGWTSVRLSKLVYGMYGPPYATLGGSAPTGGLADPGIHVHDGGLRPRPGPAVAGRRHGRLEERRVALAHVGDQAPRVA